MADKKTILHIEDEPGMVDLVGYILEYDQGERFEFCSAEDGRQGLDMIRQCKPDLILLDLMMPRMSGWEVYRQIKADDELKDIPVIVVTARSQPTEKAMGLKIAGVDAYVTKPFDPAELLAHIYQVLGMDPG